MSAALVSPSECLHSNGLPRVDDGGGGRRLQVTGGPARSHRVATLGEGAMLGEPALFGAVPRMAHVEAVTGSVVWSLCARRLHLLAGEAPALVLEVLRAAGAVMAARMRANLERGIPTA